MLFNSAGAHENRMKRLLSALFPAIGAAFLLLASGQAQADACFGGGHHFTPPAVDAGPSPDAGTTDAGMARNEGALPRRLGAGVLFLASLSTGWLFLRRNDPGDNR